MNAEYTSTVVADACYLAEQPYQVRCRLVRTDQHGQCWRADHPELPGCRGWGATPWEALDALAEARIAYLIRRLRAGHVLPVLMREME